MCMVNLTNSAKEKIKELLQDEGPNVFLRSYVQGGGCSGFQYGFTFDTEQNEDDFVIEFDNFKLLIDSMSLQYLQGSEIDFKDDLMESNFSIKNPNAETTCGCGSSFSI